jgi:hypothetical protein
MEHLWFPAPNAKTCDLHGAQHGNEEDTTKRTGQWMSAKSCNHTYNHHED